MCFSKTFLAFLTYGIFLLTSTASAKEMHGKIGVGYNAQFGSNTPAVSVRYGLIPRVQIQLLGGVTTGSPKSSVAGLKIMQTLIPQNFANFYYMLGLGLVSNTTRSGTELMGGLGAEFFIPGLDAVGFAFETGVAFENVSSASYAVKTFGSSFIEAGIHFYF